MAAKVGCIFWTTLYIKRHPTYQKVYTFGVNYHYQELVPWNRGHHFHIDHPTSLGRATTSISYSSKQDRLQDQILRSRPMLSILEQVADAFESPGRFFQWQMFQSLQWRYVLCPSNLNKNEINNNETRRILLHDNSGVMPDIHLYRVSQKKRVRTGVSIS